VARVTAVLVSTKMISSPSKEKFHQMCRIKAGFCLAASKQFSGKLTAAKRKQGYQLLLSVIKASYNGVRDLVGGHALALMSELGLLPNWIRMEAIHIKRARYVSTFEKNYGVNLKGTELDSFMKTLSAQLSYIFEETFPPSKTENVCCKTYRLWNENSQDNRWCDTFSPNQLLFSFDTERFFVHGKHHVEEYPGGLISRFPIGNELKMLNEIANDLHEVLPVLESGMNIDTLCCIKYPKNLLYPGRNLELDFDLGDNDKLGDIGRISSDKAYQHVS